MWLALAAEGQLEDFGSPFPQLRGVGEFHRVDVAWTNQAVHCVMLLLVQTKGVMDEWTEGWMDGWFEEKNGGAVYAEGESGISLRLTNGGFYC